MATTSVLVRCGGRAHPKEAPQASRRLKFSDFADQVGLCQEPGSNTLQHMLELPLPPQWSMEEGYMGQIYFFNCVAGETSWTHPQAALYKDIIGEVSSWPADAAAEDVYRWSWSYLQRAQASAAQVLSQWSGPHCIEAGRRLDRAVQSLDDLDRYFFNMTTGEYSRADPRDALEFDLLQQHMLLSYCIHYARQGWCSTPAQPQPEAKAERSIGSIGSCSAPEKSSGHGSSEESLVSVAGGGGSEDETQGSAPPSPRIQVFAPGAPRKVKVTLPFPARRHLEKESPKASPQTSPRHCLLVPRMGDDSVKSQLSFYSALSSCSEEAAGLEEAGGMSPVAAVC